MVNDLRVCEHLAALKRPPTTSDQEKRVTAGRSGAARQHVEKRRAFRATIKWRTGCEGRISTFKRGYGWDRTRLDSLEGAKTWTGQGVFTHNLTRIVALTA